MIICNVLLLTLCMLDNFHAFVVFCWLVFKINLFKKFFQEHYQSFKRFGFRSGPTMHRSWSGSKLFAKVIIISRQQNVAASKKRVNWIAIKYDLKFVYISYWIQTSFYFTISGLHPMIFGLWHKKMSSGLCKQQRGRPACASGQSD